MLKICLSVFIGEENILAKCHDNPMHVVHVKRARKCTQANLGYIFDLCGYNLGFIVVLKRTICQSCGLSFVKIGCTLCTNVHASYFGLFFRIFEDIVVRMDA